MDEKALFYLGSSEKDLKKLPAKIKEIFAHGLQMACDGETHPNSKPLKGFGGRNVVEILGD